jgi:hypothetical protein
MSTHGPENGNGQRLDTRLEEIGRAYEGLEREQPPELLDQAILNKARREVEARPRWTQFGWLHGLTTTAVFVLAFTVVLNQRETAPVEDNIEFDSSPVRLQPERATRSVEMDSAPAEIMEYRASQKAAAPLHIDSLEAAPVEEQEPIAGTLQRQAQKSASAPAKDTPVAELSVDEEMARDDPTREDADFMAVSTSATAGVAEPLAAPPEHAEKKEMRDRPASNDAEARLAEIIRLKQAGDDSWQAALEAFVEAYPDYPLPPELTD